MIDQKKQKTEKKTLKQELVYSKILRVMFFFPISIGELLLKALLKSSGEPKNIIVLRIFDFFSLIFWPQRLIDKDPENEQWYRVAGFLMLLMLIMFAFPPLAGALAGLMGLSAAFSAALSTLPAVFNLTTGIGAAEIVFGMAGLVYAVVFQFFNRSDVTPEKKQSIESSVFLNLEKDSLSQAKSKIKPDNKNHSSLLRDSTPPSEFKPSASAVSQVVTEAKPSTPSEISSYGTTLIAIQTPPSYVQKDEKNNTLTELTKQEAIQLEGYIRFNTGEEIKKEFQAKNCSYTYVSSYQMCLPSIIFAMQYGRYETIPVLAELGADANAEFFGDTPLHLAVKLNPPSNEKDQYKKIFDDLLDAKADVNKANKHGMTPLQLAVLLDNKFAVEYLAAKTPSTIIWADKPTLQDLKDLYKKLENHMYNEFNIAKKKGRPILFIIGEMHSSLESKFIEAMILNIANRLGIKNYNIELHPKFSYTLKKSETLDTYFRDSEFLDKMDSYIAAGYKMKQLPIDTGRIFTKDDYSDKGMERRNQAMVSELLKQESNERKDAKENAQNASSVTSVGNAHLIMAEHPELLEKFRVCAIATSLYDKDLLSENDSESAKFLKEKCLKIQLPGNFSQSKVVIEMLQETMKCKSLQAVDRYLVSQGIFQTGPVSATVVVDEPSMILDPKNTQKPDEKRKLSFLFDTIIIPKTTDIYSRKNSSKHRMISNTLATEAASQTAVQEGCSEFSNIRSTV